MTELAVMGVVGEDVEGFKDRFFFFKFSFRWNEILSQQEDYGLDS